MSSPTQVLARKWRPRCFSELTGQDHVVRALTNALEQKRLHHAYLFTGTRGIGKTTIARILAKAFNCQAGVTPEPCGICSACIEIDGGRFVDLIEVDAASNTQVEKMRELLENALYAPTVARYKVYIIDEVHMLSKSAFNAMLKTLEEPPEHVKFILATTDPQKIPVTVLSRCLQFNLKQIPFPLIVSHLRHVLEQEHINCDATSLQLLARAAQGSMRDALSILDQAIAFGEGKIEEASVRDMLGAVDQGYLLDLLEVLAQRDGARMLAIADAMETRSLSFDAALQDLATLLHRLALAQIVPAAIGDDEPERDRVFQLAKTFAPEDIQLFYQIAIHGREDLGRAPDEYAGFTMTLLRMLAFIPEDFLSGGGETGRDRGTSGSSPAKSGSGKYPSTLGQAQDSGQTETKGRTETKGSGRAEMEKEGRSREGRVARNDSTGDSRRSAGPVPDSPERDPRPEKPGSTEFFSHSWITIVGHLKVNGLTRMLAQYCEVKSFSEDEIEFCVPELHKHLLDKTYQDRLQAAIREYLGKPVRLKFSVGVVNGMSPAEQENREKQEKQSQAIAAIESDPFVRDLVENFDAKLIVSSIKPIQ
ncbi:DNA polymerase III subunit gamma/tau [Nitrosospira multiformis]|uniref:DNA polymerase III subunit gamma/tau n=1 Tax=Nitrosospira multiformis TaxID=1231 RepID=A0A1I7FPK9_9PROT|nr:DNA polymerase III subunit gamma/tau [Nitrosospira multiformis]SFU38134.1 DNA polymerase-3 subunit gamma/tau [Nitrosospira multiformis]